MKINKIRKHHHLLHHIRTIRRKTRWMRWPFVWLYRLLRWLNPFRMIKLIDGYIIRKFIGTYFYSIILIISISIVFDYYANFVPYFANLFSPLFVFIAVIFFTSKLAGNSEVIAMMACGMSFKRLLRPYMISAALISVLNFYLGSYVIPKGTIVKHDFEAQYKNSKNKKNTMASNVQLQVDKGVIAYISRYDDTRKTGYGFSLDKFEKKKLVSHMTANVIHYDTISDSRYHWKAVNYKIRELKGLREHISTGMELDTMIMMEPMDLIFSKGQQETFTSPELKRYISKQKDRGSSNVVQYEVEYHKRIASCFASFILTVIGASLSARKRKGGMGLALGVGLALSFSYILLQTVSSTFAINAGTPPMLAAWIPNLLYVFIAYYCYKKAPN